MATRKRRPFVSQSSESRQESRHRLRRSLLETLEQRQLLAAGPQLIGIQPNDGALIEDGVTRNIAPRVLTFRFDQGQQIHPGTLDAIQITRAGNDGLFDTTDDVAVEPGTISVGSPAGNEVLVRFADALPDDRYRIEVFGYDDPNRGIIGLRNTAADGSPGLLLQPRDAAARKESIEFDLRLGALVEAIVPQPVVRLADGSLQQRRDQIVVYFNEDELFVENDASGNPTLRSAEHPRFYQLLHTQETVRTTDDFFILPERVDYDPATHTATLTFAAPIDELAFDADGTTLQPGGGTFRLRIGTAVDDRAELIVQPNRVDLGATDPGDTFTDAYDVGLLGSGSSLSSLIVSGRIDAAGQQYPIELPGGNNDPGHRELDETAGNGFEQHVNDQFGADVTAGVTTVSYNFQQFYANSGGVPLVNAITGRMQQRVREALSLWSDHLGVQFTETTNQGITFALGNQNAVTGAGSVTLGSLGTTVRVDPTFANSLMVLNSQRQWADAYGEDFFRTVMTGIGTLLGLEYTGDLPISTLMALSPAFINSPINQNLNRSFIAQDSRPLEPIFPGSYDILHGQYLHRPDSVDIDMYRFTIDLGDDTTVGELTAETFAERLPDSSLLDTDLRLFREVKASIETNLNASETLTVRFEATAEGRLGNRTRIDFLRTDRVAGDDAVKVAQSGTNGIRIDLPRGVAVTAQQLVDAVNALPAEIVTAEIVFGDGATNINASNELVTPLLLSGGGTEELARNDDYFSEDSLLRASLTSGTYYIGVASSGNDAYDPTLAGTGNGGRTEGDYELQLKFESQVDKVDVLRDRDNPRTGLPGTPLDGDGDGVPGGETNFWFQARPEHRQLAFTAGGNILRNGQAITITSATGQLRTYQFITGVGATTSIPGAIPVQYLTSDSPAALAIKLRTAVNAQTSSTGVRLDAVSGQPSVLVFEGERSFDVGSDFRGVEVRGRTIFVDKTAGPNADGTKERPFNNISNPSVPNAFAAAMPGDVVRIVGNGGQDQKLETAIDNFAYKIGFAESAGVLEDGSTMEVPGGVTVMVDAGAVFKLRSSRISVGSSTLLVDRSGGALQVLGTPRLIDAAGDLVTRNGGAVSGDVVFTSSRDKTVAQPTPENTQAPAAGNWGGLVFRRDLDMAEGRANLEDEGIFLQYVNHADVRYGGGSNILIDAVQQTVNPIQIIDMRPTITFNRISSSADAAMSAAPNSFEETSYSAPRFQQAGSFTADYDRVGPDIHNNQLVDNSLNALFIRIETHPGAAPRQLTVPGRFDDIDIVHALSENLVLAGTPGGAIRDGVAPTVDTVTTAVSSGGGTLAPGTYDYRMTFVDAAGFESLPSNASAPVVVSGANSVVAIEGLPPTPDAYVYRRLYRRDPGTGDYVLIGELNSSDSGFFDSGQTTEGILDLTRSGVRGRLDASLNIDPGAVIKLEGARIELGIGTQLLAEGLAGQEVVFTSKLDDRYGTGGTFDTNNDVGTSSGNNAPQAGDWGGIYAAPGAHISLDHSVVAFAGGLTRIEGTIKAFNPIELQQASARITHSEFESNANGQGGQGPTGRFGRLANTPATIFARGTDPILVGNTFVDNRGSVLDIDANSFDADYFTDTGRQTGRLDRIVGLDDNRGPLVRRNLLENNDLNGMEIRGATLTTESVWDDTDIVHVLFDSVTVGNLHSSGGLRLQSRPNESLVVKLDGVSSPHSKDYGTGITATGTQADINDRVGGTVQIIGQPGYPVIMTSLKDDTVGAGRRPDGSQQTDTNNDRWGSRPTAGDWRSVLLDQWSNDRNVATVLELESPNQVAPGPNGSVLTAQVLGDLAGSIHQSDENLRLGFALEGYLSEPTDVDTYAFTGVAGTDVWIDIDRTKFTLDSVLELLDASGNVLATSDNSFAEVASPEDIRVQSSLVAGRVGPLADGSEQYHDLGSGGLYRDFDSTNLRDAGMRIALPGVAGARSVYHFRVRSGSVNPNDAAGGLTSGGYRVQVRLQEAQEFPGSTVQYADIRFANHGVHMRGLPGTSPLIGEFQENEGENQSASNNDSIYSSPTSPGRRAQYLGNLLNTDRTVIGVGGELASTFDVDFYEMVVDHNNIASNSGMLYQSAVFDVDYADGLSRPNTNLAIYYDPDGPNGAQLPRLVLFGQDSNISEDRPSPLTALASEILSRGSQGEGDAFVGPVALPEGHYYVGISNNGVVPNQIANNPNIRREPINSVQRIIDDRVETTGGYVADAPLVAEMFDRGTLPPGWDVTSDRSSDPGHGSLAVFDGSRGNTTGTNRSLRYDGSFGNGSLSSNAFSLAGYAAADKPFLYFNYLIESGSDAVSVWATSDQNPSGALLTGNGLPGGLDADGQFHQARVPLNGFAGHTGIRLEFRYETGGVGGDLFLDDFIVGFAERGEIITGATAGDDTYSLTSTGGIIRGEYQVEIREGTEYFQPVPGSANLNLVSSFDTNDRHTRAVTLLAPAGSELADGYYFELSDGAKTTTFEFDLVGGPSPNVSLGRIRIPFSPSDSAAQVATAIRNAINAPTVQGSLKIEAAGVEGNDSGSLTDNRVDLVGRVRGDWISGTAADMQVDADGRLTLAAVLHDGVGDVNVARAQSLVIVENTRISDARVYGIWSEPGDRMIDPEDQRGLFNTNIDNPWVNPVPMFSNSPGAIRNLPAANNSVDGGLVAGPVIRNNVIDQAGYVGVHIEGQMQPFTIDSNAIVDIATGPTTYDTTDSPAFGSFIPDGLAFAIDAAGTRVVFEFEDIGGDATNQAGSGQVGGDGWTDGHVPVYYRKGGGGLYNPGGPSPLRNWASSRQEVMNAIYDALLGSILVTNDLVPLIDAYQGPSYFTRDLVREQSYNDEQDFPTSAIFIQGATAIDFTSQFAKNSSSGTLYARQIPVAEAPQPFARIVNNTIYGADGTASQFPGQGTDESNDTLATAVDTRQGRSHDDDGYTTVAAIGDSGAFDATTDVDIYRFELSAGDRVQIDVNTLPGGPDTSLRLFNSRGAVQAFQQNGQWVTVSRAALSETDATPVPGDPPQQDPYVDFTATATDTYFVAVSSAGNEAFDPLSLAQRQPAAGGTGQYELSMRVLAPRQFVLSLDANGSLVGTTFTIEQIADLPGQTTNAVVFEFTNGNAAPTTPGAIRVPIADTYRVPDIMRAIAGAINGPGGSALPLPNHELNNGPGGLNGPITRVEATALGGISGDGPGLTVYDGPGLNRFHLFFGAVEDLQQGFGHNRTASAPIGGTTSDGAGTSELYVLIKNAARVTISPQAAARGLGRDPKPGMNADQLLPEIGVLASQGASPTLLNNVIINAQAAVVNEETRYGGFGQPLSRGGDAHPKKGEVIVVGSVFQNIETQNMLFRERIIFENGFNAGITTDASVGPSNVNGGSDDFNFDVGGTTTLLVNPAGNQFYPAPGSIVIDASVDSLPERSAFASLKQAVGLAVSPVLAPNRDLTGQLRADDPNVSTPSGLGSNIFKDRGAFDRADFVGPVAILDTPLDNDSAGRDIDPADSYVQLTSGSFTEFRILLRDAGDASDPFLGTGIDDATVLVPGPNGSSQVGGVLTLFEDGKLLTEGVHYTFSYDETENVITLRPLAGIWKPESVYEIALNNRDRFIATAPDGLQVADGDRFVIVDQEGGRVSFEFEAGYQLEVPEVITLGIPAAVTGAGGIADGDRVAIDDGNRQLTFEFTTEASSILPGNLPVLFSVGDTADQLLDSLQSAIQAKIDDGTLATFDPALGNVPTVSLLRDPASGELRIGMEAGGVVDASSSSLIQAARTLALQVPASGVNPLSGVADGHAFTINDGQQSVTFEFNTTGTVTGGNTPINVVNNDDADEVLAAILEAIESTELRVRPQIVSDQLLYLGLPEAGTATIGSGRIAVVSYARTLADAGTITLAPASGTPLQIELNRTDEVGGDDGVTAGNTPLHFTRTDSADEIAAAIAAAISTAPSLGLTPTAPGSGLVSIGGDTTLALSLSGADRLVISGTPGVTPTSTISVRGPLFLQVPSSGGFGIPDGDTFTITNAEGETETFLFNYEFTSVNDPNAIVITYRNFDSPVDLAVKLAAAINASSLGLAATSSASGEVLVGDLPLSAADLTQSQLLKRQGIVADGESVRITHAGQTLVFEFEEATAGGGVQPGATPVLYTAGGTTAQIADALADAIRNQAASIGLSATNVGDGKVQLTDSPQTRIDLSAAPTLSLSGAPGGANPIHFIPSASFTSEQMKKAIIEAINSVNTLGGSFITSLTAGDRGGDTLFIENAVSVDPPLENYYLPAIRDLAGLPLKANRSDGSTQFTLLLPTVGLDFGDAPDPVTTIPGRYPTRFVNDGARHVVTPTGPRLGSLVDADPDGRPGTAADGDDVAIEVVGPHDSLFTVTREALPGSDALDLVITVGASFPTDGGTITISTGLDQATLELDSDGIFDEDHYAIELSPGDSPEQIAAAIRQAILASPLRPADVVVSGNTVRIVSDDEDGVRFDSSINPYGVFNPNITTEVTVTVNGVGFVDGWVDFNGDGDWSDPGEQIFQDVFFDGSEPTRTFAVTVPASTPVPSTPLDTFARFRVSSTGGLSPSGLAIDGEVEDYAVRVVPGRPPVVADPNLQYRVNEDLTLVGLDGDGTTTPSPVDDGLLVGITDPDGDVVEVYATPSDPSSEEYILGVGTFPITTNGERDGTVGGHITINPDGRFTFNPVPDFFGDLVFQFRVTDAKAANAQDQELVNANPVTVTISVDPVNDAPTVVGPLTLQINDAPEDQPIVLTGADLIDGRFSPGPANESDQALRILSAGYGGTANVTRRGGSLAIDSSGQLIYTPPVNYTGPEPDEFVYTVVDVPGGSLIPREAAQQGTVVISFVPANDPPTAGPDAYSGVEDNQVTIPLRGVNGILTNDVPGPQDEVAEGQTISLVPGQFPRTTLRGGTVTLSGDGNSLVYTPRANFAGSDSFEYQIVDSDGSNPRTAFGTVTINVAPVNDAAIYAGPNSLGYIESKDTAKSYTIDLNTWFTDPETDALSFTVTSGNSSLVQTSVSGGTLTLTLPPFQNGVTDLTITATNPGGTLPTQVTIPVTVTNTPDAPRLIGTLDPLQVDEDEVISEDLSTVFSDPDGGPLSYSVVTPAGEVDPFDRSLVESVTFQNGRMNIALVPDASGSTEITIRAFDGQFEVFETFTLAVAAQPDVPTGGTDNYTVPVRGRLVIIDPRAGLMANDSEADGDAFTIDTNSVVQPANGTVTVNANGTFTYTNLSNDAPGQTDSFSYRLIDKDGLSQPVQVVITMTRSTHQNPINRLDTTGDGLVSPVDALRGINLLNRQSGTLAVRDLPAPPDYYDVDGNGLVTPLDVLAVINHLNRNSTAGEGESSVDLRTGASTAWVAAGTWNLPQSGFVASTTEEDPQPSESQPTEPTSSQSGDFFAELRVVDGRLAGAVDALLASDRSDSGNDPDSTDAALSDLWSDLDSDMLSN